MENKKPIRKKAVETRQKLLTATLELIARKGYHNVTVDEIAKEANLATGTAYRYFQNKKEMLIEALKFYFAHINDMTDTKEEILKQFDSLEEMMSYVLDQFYELHKKYYDIHEELESLKHIDPEVKAVYDAITLEAIDHILEECPPAIAKLPHAKERIYLAISLLENYAHLQIDDKSREFDMETMKKLTLESVMKIVEL